MQSFSLLLAGILLSAPVVAEEPEIMPVEEIREGMTGYGYTVFHGTEPERFEFVVRGVVPNYYRWPEVILVQLFGGPTDSDGKSAFENSQIFNGMSGSPMYINGRLIGGLALSPDFQTASKALVTPIKYQREMGHMLKGEIGIPSHVVSGSYLATCFVYGDLDRCFFSTATARLDGLLFTTAHGIDMPYGKYRLPVFEVPVVDLMKAEKNARKIAGYRGDPVGTAVVHKAFGFVVKEGVLPEPVSVRLLIEDVYSVSKIVTLNMAPEVQATEKLAGALRDVIEQLPIDAKAAHLHIVVTFESFGGKTIRFTDTPKTAILSLENVLDVFLKQERESLHIASIELTYSVSDRNDLWIPLSIKASGKNEKGVVTILGRRTRDNSVVQMSASLDLRLIKSYDKERLAWFDGTSLQALILSRMPAIRAFDLLAQIENREALYLVWLENVTDIKPLGKAKPGEYIERTTGIRILTNTTFGGRRFYVNREGKGLLFSND